MRWCLTGDQWVSVLLFAAMFGHAGGSAAYLVFGVAFWYLAAVLLSD